MRALFRCDAGEGAGFGHLSRCLALAEALALDGVEPIFAGHFEGAAGALCGEAGFARHDCVRPIGDADEEASVTDHLQATLAPDFWVFDSYKIREDTLAALKARGIRVVLIDDFATLSDYSVNAVLNFTCNAPHLAYPGAASLLLGPQYFLARRALVATREASIAKERAGPVKNLLIAIGGADPHGLAARLVRALAGLGADLRLRIVTDQPGDIAQYLPHFAADSALLGRQPNLGALIADADACITGGGLIKYECAYLGVPAAAIAQNAGQDAESASFAKAGLVHDLGQHDQTSDAQLRTRLAQFLADDAGRASMAKRMRAPFPPDPAAIASRAILDALEL